MDIHLMRIFYDNIKNQSVFKAQRLLYVIK